MGLECLLSWVCGVVFGFALALLYFLFREHVLCPVYLSGLFVVGLRYIGSVRVGAIL